MRPLAGPIDSAIPGDIAADLLAVLRAALSNVVRHAGATSVQVTIRVASGMVTTTVSDDGRGIPADVNRSGLKNLDGRAQRTGGTFEVRPNVPTGTVIEWCVPL